MSNPEQHRSALDFANQCRLRRAQLGREIKAGEVKVSDLLREPVLPDWLKGEAVGRLLQRAPRLGPRRVNTLLAELHIGQRRPVGELTYRQRRELGDEIAVQEGIWNQTGRRARRRFGSTVGSASAQVSAGGGF